MLTYVGPKVSQLCTTLFSSIPNLTLRACWVLYELYIQYTCRQIRGDLVKTIAAESIYRPALKNTITWDGTYVVKESVAGAPQPPGPWLTRLAPVWPLGEGWPSSILSLSPVTCRGGGRGGWGTMPHQFLSTCWKRNLKRKLSINFFWIFLILCSKDLSSL